MTTSDQLLCNMVSGAPETLKPGILVASSPNINLSTNRASKAISEHLIWKKKFRGEHAPDPPSIYVLSLAPLPVPSPNLKIPSTASVWHISDYPLSMFNGDFDVAVVVVIKLSSDINN